MDLGASSALYLEAHKTAYDIQYIKPKMHWLMDIGPQILRDNMVLDAFVIERQHLLVKSVAEKIKNTSCFEESLMASVLTVQLRQCRDQVIGDGLVGRTARLQGYLGVLVADKVSVHSVEVRSGDVVMKEAQPATVVACASEGLGIFLFVDPMVQVLQITSHAGQFRPTQQLALWRAHDVSSCLAWRHNEDGTVLVLRG